MWAGESEVLVHFPCLLQASTVRLSEAEFTSTQECAVKKAATRGVSNCSLAASESMRFAAVYVSAMHNNKLTVP
jgi:hypothetical protein